MKQTTCPNTVRQRNGERRALVRESCLARCAGCRLVFVERVTMGLLCEWCQEDTVAALHSRINELVDLMGVRRVKAAVRSWRPPPPRPEPARPDEPCTPIADLVRPRNALEPGRVLFRLEDGRTGDVEMNWDVVTAGGDDPGKEGGDDPGAV